MDNFNLTGTILVHNVCFEKQVKVRYSTDYWLTHDEVVAAYSSSVATDIDKFSFSLSLPTPLPPGARVELCVCACLGGEEYWDSNSGKNYQIECLLLPPNKHALSFDLLSAGVRMAPAPLSKPNSSDEIYY